MGRYSSITVVGALAGLDTVDTAEIDDDAVTYAKVQNVAADDVLLGRISGADGIVEEVTKAQALTLLGVEADATADQTGAEIKTAYEAEANAYTDTKNTKLAGIDTGADVTADNTPQTHEASHKSSGSDEILIDELGTPTDVTTLNSSITAHGLLKKLDNSATNFMNGQGNWVEPVGGAVITSGNYTGNNTVNRAIPHGLGVTPKLIVAYRTGGGQYDMIKMDVIGYHSNAVDENHAVTIADSTNFYVGNAADYSESMNNSTHTYYWVAMG